MNTVPLTTIKTTVINTASKQIAGIIIGDTANMILLSKDGAKAYVSRGNSNKVSVINTATNTVSTNLIGFHMPYGLALSPDGFTLLVVNNDAQFNTVSVVNTASNIILKDITVGTKPTNL